MFTNVLTLLTLVTPSASADAPASCSGRTGADLTACQEQRAAAQAIELANLSRQLEVLERQCEQACDNTPAAAPVSTGPSRIRVDMTAVQKRVADLEKKVGNGGISKEEFNAAIQAIRAEIAEIEPIPGRDGRDGVDGQDGQDGKDGKDGLSMEFDLSPGGFVFATRDGGTTVWGANLGVTVGMPIRDVPVHFGVRFEGLGSYDGVSLNDGGFAIGVVTGVDIVSQLRLEASGLWQEFGVDIADQSAREAFQGLSAGGRVVLDLNPNKAPVLGVYAGGRAWFQGEDDGNVIGYAELGLHLQLGG